MLLEKKGPGAEGGGAGGERAILLGTGLQSVPRAVYGGGGGPNGGEGATAQGGRGRREVVMLTDPATGQQMIQMRFSADVMSERDRLEARNVFRAAGGLGPGDHGANPAAERAEERGPEPGEESRDQ